MIDDETRTMIDALAESEFNSTFSRAFGAISISAVAVKNGVELDDIFAPFVEFVIAHEIAATHLIRRRFIVERRAERERSYWSAAGRGFSERQFYLAGNFALTHQSVAPTQRQLATALAQAASFDAYMQRMQLPRR